MVDSSIRSLGRPLSQGPLRVGNTPAVNNPHAKVVQDFGTSLTDDQRSSILKTINVLQKSGESFDEIKFVVDNFLEDNGITPPDQIGKTIPLTGPLSNKGVISQLSKDDLSFILDEVNTLKNSKVNFDEVKEMIDLFLEKNGITPRSFGGTFIDVLT